MEAAGSNPANISNRERRIGPRELREHRHDLWVAIHGRVYGLAEFHDHPGGIDILRHEAGRDATRVFDEIGHSRVAKRMLPQYDLGAFISVEEEAAIEDSRIEPTAVTSSQVTKPIGNAEHNGTAEVGNRSADCNLTLETAMPNVGSPIDSVKIPKQSIEENGAADKVTKGVRPPAPSFQQNVLVGEIHRRPKQPLAPGFSAMAWLRHQQSIAARPPRSLKMAEVAQHSRPDDAWIVLHGLVYDVTPYLHYHPGGVEELLRGAGRDASLLFESTHPWVNVNALLMKCCVGTIDLD